MIDRRLPRGATVALLDALALLGCETSGSLTPPGSPQYKSGYVDGCDSAYAAAGKSGFQAKKDDALYVSNLEYKEGWEDGFGLCKSRLESE